jgi:hypothetical protein
MEGYETDVGLRGEGVGRGRVQKGSVQTGRVQMGAWAKAGWSVAGMVNVKNLLNTNLFFIFL